VVQGREGPATWLARRERMLAKGYNGNGAGMPLTIAAKLWPTPTAGDWKGSGSRNAEGSKAHKGVSLPDAVQTGDSHGRRSRPDPTTSMGGDDGSTPADRPLRLNVAFVEMLMGFPRGWTLPAQIASAVSETP
jgi:hypothetical protein